SSSPRAMPLALDLRPDAIICLASVARLARLLVNGDLGGPAALVSLLHEEVEVVDRAVRFLEVGAGEVDAVPEARELVGVHLDEGELQGLLVHAVVHEER